LDTTSTASCEINIYPYVELDGIRTFTDTWIRDLFARMVKEGVLTSLFLDGTVQEPGDLIARFKREDHKFFIVAYGDEPAGLIWLTDFRQATVYVHFWIFKKFRGTDKGMIIALHGAKEFLYMRDHEGKYIFDVLFGYISAENKPVVSLFNKLEHAANNGGGFGITGKILGTIPNAMIDYYKDRSVDAIMAYLVREEATP